MLPCQQSLLRKLVMRVMPGTHHNQVDCLISEEVDLGAVMLGLGVIDCAVDALFDNRLVFRCLFALEKSVDFKVRIRGDEWEMEAFGRESVTYQANFNWRHIGIRVWSALKIRG